MRAAPPARRVGGVAAVRRPGIAGVFVQPVKAAHVLGVAHGLEHPHVAPAGKDIRAPHGAVGKNNAARHIFGLVQAAVLQLVGQRGHKIAPNQRRVRHARHRARGNFGKVDDVEVPLQIRLAPGAGRGVVIEHMQRVILFVFRVDAIARKAAAQPVRAGAHGRNGAHGHVARHARAVLRKHPEYRAPRRNAHLPFPLHGQRPFPTCPPPRADAKKERRPRPRRAPKQGPQRGMNTFVLFWMIARRRALCQGMRRVFCVFRKHLCPRRTHFVQISKTSRRGAPGP